MHFQILTEKKFLILTIVLLWTLLMLSGCGGGPSPAPPVSSNSLTGIIVQPDTMTLEIGKSKNVSSAIAYYSDSSTADIPLSNCVYNSNNPSCVTVNSSGLITGISAGTTIVFVSYTEGAISKTDTVEVTVNQNEVIYRAYCVGVGDYMHFPDEYGNIDLEAPPYDVDRMCYTFSKCRFGPSNTEFSKIWYIIDQNATKSNILQGIANVFSEADYNDVSYFYFSGHGINYEGTSYLCPTETSYSSPLSTLISANELENALSAIPGTKVVILDSCYSGGFIGKQMQEEKIISNSREFNDNVINSFLFRDLAGSQYKVLTSCLSYQECIELIPAEGEGSPFGLFSGILCEGCGYDSYTHLYPADGDENGKITLQEAYTYTNTWVNIAVTELNELYGWNIDQDTQVYPPNSDFVIIE